MKKVEWAAAREIFMKADGEARAQAQREEEALTASVERDLRRTSTRGWAVMFLLGFSIVGFLYGMTILVDTVNDYVRTTIGGQ